MTKVNPIITFDASAKKLVFKMMGVKATKKNLKEIVGFRKKNGKVILIKDNIGDLIEATDEI